LTRRSIETIGVEGTPDALRHVVCRAEQVVIRDLARPFELSCTFDLAICIEAEQSYHS
jgi:hypothetical protein